MTPRRGAPIEDKGATFHDGFQAIIHNGACAFGKYTDFRLEPPRTLSTEAQEYRAKIAHPPFELVISNLASIKKTLTEDGGKPLPAGFRLSQEFHEQTDFEPRIIPGDPDREVKVWNQPGQPLNDIHAMLITGYDDRIQAFEVLNSHGKEWGDDGYLWVDYDFFKSKDAKGKLACCQIVYSYTPVRSGLLGLHDRFRNIFRFMFGPAVDAAEPDGYCRIATIEAGRTRIRPDDLNFEMEPDTETLEKVVQRGAVLTLRKGVTRLALRSDLLIDPANGNTTLGEKFGELRRGDRFKITDLKKATLQHGKRIEYWAKGFRLD